MKVEQVAVSGQDYMLFHSEFCSHFHCQQHFQRSYEAISYLSRFF